VAADRGERKRSRSNGGADDDEASSSTMMADDQQQQQQPTTRAAPGAAAAPAESEAADSTRVAPGGPHAVPLDASATRGFDLNFPVEGQRGPGVILKFYGDDAREVKLCDTLEVIGVLSCAPELSGAYDSIVSAAGAMDADGMPVDGGNAGGAAGAAGAASAGGDATHPRHDFGGFEEETVTRHPPASLVPRVHVISARRLGCLHPALPPVGSAEREAAARAAIADTAAVAALRGEIVRSLALYALGGDELAAEYALMHLLSRARETGRGAQIGRLCVNYHSLAHFAPATGAAAALAEFYSAVLPAAVHAPLTLDNLNRGRFVPAKCYTRNRLTSGMLQMPHCGALVVDATLLSTGNLSAAGVAQLGSVAHFLRSSDVRYDFGFHTADLVAHAAAAVISEAPSSVLQCDVKIKVVPQTGAPSPRLPAKLSGFWGVFLRGLLIRFFLCRVLMF
jgi:hypothetical protein